MNTISLISLGVTALTGWIYYCFWKTHKDAELIHSVVLNKLTNKDQMNWWYHEQNFGLITHCWYRLTFRNPWQLWGPITISIIYHYDMTKGDFWDYYRYAYLQVISLRGRRCVCKKMLGYGWRHTGSTCVSHPMSAILHCNFNIDINQCRPKPVHVDCLAQGAEEYDEIMRVQAFMGQA